MENLEVPKESSGDTAYAIVKGTLGILPAVGSVASETFGLILTQPITKRREKWMQAVVEKLLQLEKTIEGFRIESLKHDEEFVSFLIESSQIAFKTHQEKKLEFLQASIGNYYHFQFKFDKKASFLRIIDDLTVTHFDILFFIAKHESLIVEKIKGFEPFYALYSNDDKGLDKFYFRKCVRDLEAISLIRISGDFHDFIGGGGFATDEHAPSIKLLDNGVEFIEYVLKDKNHL